MSRALLVFVALQLAAPQQPPPTIRVVRDAQDEVTLETPRGSERLPFGTVVSVPFHQDAVFRFSTNQKQPVTVAARDLIDGDTWHVIQDSRTGALSLWSSAGHVATMPAAAVVITAESPACSPAQQFRLSSLMTAGARVPVPLVMTPDVARCRWIVFGLAPGSYEAALFGPDGSQGKREFRVLEGKPSDVTIAPPAVTVSGVVTINGRPVTKGVMRFSRDVQAWTVLIDETGSYELKLDEDGEYVLTMVRPFSRFEPLTVRLASGPNIFDWNINDPSADSQIAVSVTGLDRSSDTEIEFEFDGARLPGSVIPAGNNILLRTGLPFGTYRVAARQPGGSSDWRDVALTEAAPMAAITLSIARASRSITLRYADGEPVVSAGLGFPVPRPEETAPGTYSLASIPPQTHLVIWPPLGTRLCRVVPASGDIEATVHAGRSVTLRFQNRGIAVDDVRISTALDCPIPLGIFLKSPLRVGAETADVEVLNAPPDEVLTIHTRDGVHRVAVRADGSAFIPAKR